MTASFVYDAVRTPLGQFGGALAVVLENVQVEAP